MNKRIMITVGLTIFLLIGSGVRTHADKSYKLIPALLLLPAQVSAQVQIWDGSAEQEGHGSHQAITTLNDGIECRMTTFEGGGQFQEIHLELNWLIEGSGMHFPGWRTLTSGSYANNPSPVTIAILTAASHEVTFDQPVSAVSFYYASVPDVTLRAFDAAGTLVASVTGSSNVQPTSPYFSVWELLGVAVDDDIITRVTVAGSQFATAIDDMTACRSVATAADLLIALISNVIALDLRHGISTSLDAKLDAVMWALDDVNANNDVAAVNSLNAFINAVRAQAGNAISLADADALIAAANNILALL